MPAANARRPVARPALSVPRVDDAATAKAVDALSETAKRADARAARAYLTADLATGANRINHGLGRTPRGVNLTPTSASAAFGWAMTAADERTVTITVVGGPQTAARLEVY